MPAAPESADTGSGVGVCAVTDVGTTVGTGAGVGSGTIVGTVVETGIDTRVLTRAGISAGDGVFGVTLRIAELVAESARAVRA